MKFLKTVLFLLLTISVYAQIRFEKGFLVDNNNQRKDVLIKNIDWLNNPKTFEYKLDENSSIQIGNLNNVKEFGVDNGSHYINTKVKIDRSSDNINGMSDKIDPEFSDEDLFLKVIVEGNANLYEYVGENIQRYFFNNKSGEIEQLIYKRYKTEQNHFAYSRLYKGQLSQNYNCSSISKDRFKKLDYRRNSLIKVFIEINECSNSGVSYSVKDNSKKADFNLWIRPKLNNTKMIVETTNQSVDFGNSTNLTLGIEGELILPFNKNKWGIIIEPTYNYFEKKHAKVNAREDYGDTSSIKYSAIEIPIGIRHYFFIDAKSKIFINAQFMFSVDLDKEVNFYRQDVQYRTMELNSRSNFVFGIGYNFNNKINAEFRVYTDKNIMDYLYWRTSKMSNISFTIGYNLF